MNKKIDMAEFMKECMLTNDDKKQMMDTSFPQKITSFWGKLPSN